MSLAEVMTAVKEKIPAVAVVFNNGQWGAEKKNQIDYFDSRFVGTNLANPDFSEVARVMGAEGYRVEHEDEVSDALKAALKSGKPVGGRDHADAGTGRAVPPRRLPPAAPAAAQVPPLQRPAISLTALDTARFSLE